MYDALLLVSFGGPEHPDDVLPFLANVTRGRGSDGDARFIFLRFRANGCEKRKSLQDGGQDRERRKSKRKSR